MPTDTFFNLPEAKRRRIERLAIEEFAEHDYHRASVSRLVERAGIAKGSFYQYFEDKAELFQYLLSLAGQEKARFLEQAFANEGQGNVFDQLRRLIRQGLEFEFSHPGLAQIGYRAYYGDAPFSKETMQQLRQGGSQFFAQLIARGKAEGSIDAAINGQHLGWLFGVVFNNLGDYLLNRLALEPEELGRQGTAAMNHPDFEPVVNEIIGLLERLASVPGEHDAD